MKKKSKGKQIWKRKLRKNIVVIKLSGQKIKINAEKAEKNEEKSLKTGGKCRNFFTKQGRK